MEKKENVFIKALIEALEHCAAHECGVGCHCEAWEQGRQQPPAIYKEDDA